MKAPTFVIPSTRALKVWLIKPSPFNGLNKAYCIYPAGPEWV